MVNNSCQRWPLLNVQLYLVESYDIYALFSLSFATLQVNLNRLKLFETYSLSRATFQSENPTINHETVICPYRSQSFIPVPNNFHGSIIPDSLSVLCCYATKAANASKNVTISCMKVFECKNRSLVYQNIELYRSLRPLSSLKILIRVVDWIEPWLVSSYWSRLMTQNLQKEKWS